MGYFDQQGIIKNSNLKRYSARFNSSRKFIDDKLNISTQITLANTEDQATPITDNAGFEGDLWAGALRYPPTQPVKGDQHGFDQPGGISV